MKTTLLTGVLLIVFAIGAQAQTNKGKITAGSPGNNAIAKKSTPPNSQGAGTSISTPGSNRTSKSATGGGNINGSGSGYGQPGLGNNGQSAGHSAGNGSTKSGNSHPSKSGKQASGSGLTGNQSPR